MIETAVARLASEDQGEIRQLVRVLAQKWPNEPALSIAFAITSAAAHYEDVVSTQATRATSALGYRLAALVAADVYAVEAMGQSPAKAQDLLHFWRRVDPYFLEH